MNKGRTLNTLSTWQHVLTISGYGLWIRVDTDFTGPKYVWNITENPLTPPDSDGGYYNLESILKLKGLAL